MVTLQIAHSEEVYEVRPTKIIALGLNYRDHIAESKSVDVKGFTEEIPEEPILFPKTPNVLIGPGEPIVIPAFIDTYHFEQPRTDYEAELALIINRTCKNVSASEAMSVVLGFTCMNDVSQRNIQRDDKSGWFRGKSFDTFGPIGPQVVLTHDLQDPQQLEIVARLNGSEVQHSNTRYMIFDIPHIIEFVSRNFTLYEHDLLLTGTPSGVGPLKHGDIIEIEIEGIGTLKNPVEKEQPSFEP